MKKLLSCLLLTCILASTVLFSAGCGMFKKKIDSGTEAAKLLLANERMDEDVVSSKINIGFSSEKTRSLSNGRLGGLNFKTLSRQPITLLNTSARASNYTWSEFPQYSSSAVEFNQFMVNVEEQVSRAAEAIADMKSKVGITDKWVEFGGEKQMLRVYDNRDVLFRIGIYNDIHVFVRYTDENAKNVYELFSFMDYDDGTTGEIRTMMIPGERYEYMYNNSNGFTDYFIAENSRGYWMNTRFGYLCAENGHRSASFSPYVVKDGLGFGAFLQTDNDTQELRNEWYTVFDPEEKRELFRVREYSDTYQFDLYFTAIRDGLVSVSSSSARDDFNDHKYQTGELETLKTVKGEYQATPAHELIPQNDFIFNGGYVQYLYGDEIHYGSANFAIKNDQLTMDEACDKFGAYASSLGLELYCNMNTVASSLEHAELLNDGFGESFTWNGYKMNNIENVELARGVLQDQFDEARAMYEEIKDNEVVDSRQKLSNKAHFAELVVSAKGENRFSGKTVSLSGITVSTDDVALFEAEGEYVLLVGLSLLDENGNPLSTNTVSLKGTDPTSVLFTGNSISLTATGSYEIPANLGRGEYAVVVYVATKDEEIRVSELCKVAFVNIEGGTIESSAMAIEAFERDSHLICRYEIKNRREITMTADKSAYSYEEIERIIKLEILTYGAPLRGAVLEDEQGNAIEKSASLGKGTYRIMCYLPTADGLAQSYVYLYLS